MLQVQISTDISNHEIKNIQKIAYKKQSHIEYQQIQKLCILKLLKIFSNIIGRYEIQHTSQQHIYIIDIELENSASSLFIFFLVFWSFSKLFLIQCSSTTYIYPSSASRNYFCNPFHNQHHSSPFILPPLHSWP